MDAKIESKKDARKQEGFTLIEILVVIGLIALLAAIVIIAINPAKQFAQGRNSQRESNVNSILNAVGQRMADNKGTFGGDYKIGTTTYHCSDMPNASTTTEIVIKFTDGGSTAQGDLGCLVPTYISKALKDPQSTADVATDSGYTLQADGAGRITICAPKANDEKAIPDASKICITR